MPKIVIANKETTEHAHMLMYLGRAELPVAIRQTLNRAAFDTKAILPKKASSMFRVRNKSFFRAKSRFNNAKGLDIDRMVSEVGIIDTATTSKVAQNLEDHEYGTPLTSRKLVPHDKARVGGNLNRKIRRKNRFDNDIIPDKSLAEAPVKNKRARHKPKSRAVARMFEAKKSGKLVLLKNSNNPNPVYYRVDKLQSNVKRKKLVVKTTPVYVKTKSKIKAVKKTPFMRESTFDSADRINDNFIHFAQKRIAKKMHR